MAKKTAAKPATSKRIVIDEAHKIIWLSGKANPFKEKSKVWARVECVRQSSGKTAKAILARKIARASTLRWVVRHGLARVGA